MIGWNRMSAKICSIDFQKPVHLQDFVELVRERNRTSKKRGLQQF